MIRTSSIIVAPALVIGMGIVFFGRSGSVPDSRDAGPAQNVEVRGGVQYITINARGGSAPKVSTAQSGVPTKLVVRTNGTYDCSASLAIRSIGYQKILPQTGEEVIDLGTPQVGETVRGTCGMGMYGFRLEFI